MRIIKFEIHEKAKGKERPRLNTYANKGRRVYTPTQTKLFENAVVRAFVEQHGNEFEKFEGPVRANIIVYYQVPDYLSEKKKLKTLFTPKISKPDCDNIAKAILDALNRVAYRDDAQVSGLYIEKYYGIEDKILVTLSEYE